jgi:hypothetical protein
MSATTGEVILQVKPTVDGLAMITATTVVMMKALMMGGATPGVDKNHLSNFNTLS